MNGHSWKLKGLSWFGLEVGDSNVLLGLNRRSLDEILQFLVDNNFNAIRIPFSTKWALDYDSTVRGSFRDGGIDGQLSRRDFLNKVISRAADYKILVMLDSHRLDDQSIPELWYSPEYPYEAMLQAWDTILGDVKHHWNVFAIDLKNEPHGLATWGTGDESTDWNTAAEKIGAHLLEKHPEFTGLVFVEGLGYSIEFESIKAHPINFGKREWNDRLVYSPHQYGPSVTGDEHFKGYVNFPDSQLSEWERCWGFIEETTGHACVLGEWGGQYDSYHNDKDMVWQNRFAKYLVEKCLSDQFVWDLNPESGDTGGVLKSNWWDEEEAKLALYHTVQPHPSWLYKEGDHFYLEPGKYANPKCDPNNKKQ